MSQDKSVLDAGLLALAWELRLTRKLLQQVDKMIADSEERIRAFEAKMKPQSPTGEHTAGQEDTDQGKAQ